MKYKTLVESFRRFLKEESSEDYEKSQRPVLQDLLSKIYKLKFYEQVNPLFTLGEIKQ